MNSTFPNVLWLLLLYWGIGSKAKAYALQTYWRIMTKGALFDRASKTYISVQIKQGILQRTPLKNYNDDDIEAGQRVVDRPTQLICSLDFICLHTKDIYEGNLLGRKSSFVLHISRGRGWPVQNTIGIFVAQMWNLLSCIIWARRNICY